MVDVWIGSLYSNEHFLNDYKRYHDTCSDAEPGEELANGIARRESGVERSRENMCGNHKLLFNVEKFPPVHCEVYWLVE